MLRSFAVTVLGVGLVGLVYYEVVLVVEPAIPHDSFASKSYRVHTGGIAVYGFSFDWASVVLMGQHFVNLV
jgi:hypothetical protein